MRSVLTKREREVFELLIKNKKSVILPKSLRGLLKARIKQLSKNQDISFIFDAVKTYR